MLIRKFRHITSGNVFTRKPSQLAEFSAMTSLGTAGGEKDYARQMHTTQSTVGRRVEERHQVMGQA